ncbi:MAG: MFS transporter [Pseudomonadales bacterium]|jgi:metabolite-proton symporter|nr:MFS transporter [Acidiferrobacteraceae bacterium]MDP6375453.1 MFS transporter [Pseudomonadales bacterium]MDP6470642.1 MFS transporter [Pseudomonadales bacterium]MDP6828502.1 MFS transporter [Pseudomonadales bacterium]MDP6970513.1 MFS transporter [Pseudomonadales bacterium]
MTSTTDTSSAAASARSMRRVALTALAGTSIEWFDFFLYGTAAALVFPAVFFSEDMPPYVSLIASFSTFAVGFLARPVGGVLFGHFGDRVGRKSALVTALLMMGIATTLIGALPDYSTIGAVAPLLLILLRFTQGLAVGGQWGGAMLLVTENAPPEQRGYYGAFAQAGAPVGLILANLAFLATTTTLSDDAFMNWGWRIPFLASVVLIGLSLYVQLKLEDTPAFRELQARRDNLPPTGEVAPSRPSPVLTVLREYPREITLGAGAFLAVQVTFYILITFVIAYGSNPVGLGLSRETMLTAVLISSAVQIPVLFICARFSDRHGRRGIYMLGATLLGVWAFFIFPLIDTAEFLFITLSVSVGQIFIGMMYGPQAALLAELFTTEVRYSGASLGYQLGAILGGAMAPIVATALLATFDSTLGIAIYVAFACALTLASVYSLNETYQANLEAD